MTRSHPNQLIETKTEYDQEEFLNQVVRLALDEAECISNAETVETVAPARPPQHLTLPPAPESPILCSPMTATTMNSTRRASFSLSSVSNSPRPSSFTDSPRPNYLAEGGLPMLHVPLSPMNLNGNGNNTGTPTGTSPAVTPRQGTSRAPCRHKMNCHLRSRCKFFHPPEHQMFWQVLERYDPLAKTELCRHQLTNKRGCRMGPESCRFSHSPHDSWCRRCGEVGHVQSECAVPAPAPSSTGDQPKPLKTAICRHWARGECTNVNCTFAHGEADAHCMKCQRTGHVTASCPRHLASRVGLAG